MNHDNLAWPKNQLYFNAMTTVTDYHAPLPEDAHEGTVIPLDRVLPLNSMAEKRNTARRVDARRYQARMRALHDTPQDIADEADMIMALRIGSEWLDAQTGEFTQNPDLPRMFPDRYRPSPLTKERRQAIESALKTLGKRIGRVLPQLKPVESQAEADGDPRNDDPRFLQAATDPATGQPLNREQLLLKLRNLLTQPQAEPKTQPTIQPDPTDDDFL